MERKMSQEALCIRVMGARSAISKIESGKYDPSRFTLICFAEVFGVTIDHFFKVSTA
ncbi:helix-turn-helix domain-containing protein [Bacillus toyonensis]|uniref:helix-turn-helix domain-containing protein n=1 Tax=Bacillus toyonensis TaxID=155322 RepID=UPI0036F3295E